MARERGPAQKAGELRQKACAVVHCKGSADDCVHTRNFRAALARARGQCKSCCRSRTKEVAWCLVVVIAVARAASWLFGPFAVEAVVGAVVLWAKVVPNSRTAKAKAKAGGAASAASTASAAGAKVNFHCSHCQIQCNGPKQMAQHLASDKHKNTVSAAGAASDADAKEKKAAQCKARAKHFKAGDKVKAKYRAASRTWKPATVVATCGAGMLAGGMLELQFDGFDDTISVPASLQRVQHLPAAGE